MNATPAASTPKLSEAHYPAPKMPEKATEVSDTPPWEAKRNGKPRHLLRKTIKQHCDAPIPDAAK